MDTWATGIETITLFVDDLSQARDFYRSTLGLDLIFEDADSAVFRVGATMINLLVAAAAGDLIAPARVAGAEAGHRMLLTVRVDAIDDHYADLSARGVQFVTPPTDQPWGRRTAAFRDPAGHLWELAQ